MMYKNPKKNFSKINITRIGAHFGVCRPLESWDKSYNLLSFCGNGERKRKKNNESFFVAESACNSKNKQLDLVIKENVFF